MTHTHRFLACLALALAVLLCACGASAFADAAPREVTVDSVDALLAAIDTDTTIYLKPGEYNLSTASDYGLEFYDGPYTWSYCYDGYELVIRNVSGLTLQPLPGEGDGEVLITAIPRYAEVIRFESCRDLSLWGLTLGHTTEPGFCAGGVLELDSCADVSIVGCGLYGCGVLGLQTVNCERINAFGCAIYQCSSGAVYSWGSRDLRLIECEIRDCGKAEAPAYSLFDINSTAGFALVNSLVHDNIAEYCLLDSSSSEVYFLGSEIGGNRLGALFASNLVVPVVDACSFPDNEIDSYFSQDSYFSAAPFVRSPDGQELGEEELRAMRREERGYDGPALAPSVSVTGTPGENGMEYRVSTVDELLSVIGSDTTVYLEGELFDWSTASNYGVYGGENYYWVDYYDGPSLIVCGVSNFHLIGQGKENTTLQAVPRYADVLAFENCSDISVTGLTAGHLKGEFGTCSGDVLAFQDCRDFLVSDCGLFGCGVYGLRVCDSAGGRVLDTEIYECSSGAAQLYRSEDLLFEGCSVHDCVSRWEWDAGTPVNQIYLYNCEDCLYNGTALHEDYNEVGDAALLPGQKTRESDASAGLTLLFHEMQLHPEDGFTMHVGDGPLQFTARLDGAVQPEGLRYLWISSDPSCLSLTPSPDGTACGVSCLAPAEGGVALVVAAQAEGFSAAVALPVYLLP